MDALKTQNVPCLALVLGNEVSLPALCSKFAPFPQGVTYPQFQHILSLFLPLDGCVEHAVSGGHHVPDRKAVTAATTTTLTASPVIATHSFGTHNVEAPVSTATALQSSLALCHHSIDGAAFPTDASHPLPRSHAVESQDANRAESRLQRLSTLHELAGLSATPTSAVKQLFNRIDVHNEQRVTWASLLSYLVQEANAGVPGLRINANRTKVYSFSRALRCPGKQHGGAAAAAELAGRMTSAGGGRGSSAYKRFHLDTQDGRTKGLRAAVSEGSGVVRVDSNLSLIRLLDGLKSHKSVFFLSTRTQPFVLYSKETLERVFAAPADMLGEAAAPTAVAYLADRDLFLSYSTEDRLLRGWISLLAPAVATVTLAPLLIEGFVRRLHIMPPHSPTHAMYAESVFLGDSYGHVVHVTAPRGRAGGMAFCVQRVYRGLHSSASGGLVDFCVFGHRLYTSGFDGRLVATELESGAAVEVGSVKNEHLHELVFVAEHGGLVAATSSTRQLLWWEAGGQSALPGTPFEHAGYGDHDAAIVAVVYVDESDYLVSADCEGVVKVWEMTHHRCVQSFQASRTSTSEGSDDHSPEATLKSQGRAKGASSAGAGMSAGFTAGAGRDLMMLNHSGLHALMPDGVSGAHIGAAHCHSLSYCAETEELLCGFVNSVACWGMHGHRNPFLCDADEVCQDVVFDVRQQTFLLQGATRLSVWDAVHGVRTSVLDRAAQRGTTYTSADIAAVCLDTLGSRLFLAAGDGNVYAYSTHALATDSVDSVGESSSLWCAASSMAGRDGKPVPMLITQMHFSSTLRTWLAVTSFGTLMVRIEAGSPLVSSTTLSVSPYALVLLRVSEELGLVAVVDSESTVFLYDMQAWTDAPQVRPMASYGRIVDVTFLDDAPVLVTVHVGGVCRCWSCPPALERFELLALIRHPLLPPPVVRRTVLDDVVLNISATTPPTTVRLGSADTSFNASTIAASTRPASAVGAHEVSLRADSARGLSHTRALSASVRTRGAASLRDTVREGGERVAARPSSRAGSSRAAETSRDTAVVPRRSMSRQSSRRRTFLTAAIEAGAARRDSRGVSPHDLLTNSAERARALASEAHDFTSIAYDGRSHHLFLGDAEGVVHVYSTCALLQFYALPRCTYASRPAFSLAVPRQRQRGNAAGSVENGRRAPEVLGSPLLLRSVDVHVRSRERSVARKRSPSATAAARLLTPGSMAQSPKHGAGGVVSLRWLPERGVLATTGNDREVWLLSAEGDRLGFLSAERLPPRPRAKKAAQASTPESSGAAGQLDPLATSTASRRAAPTEAELPLQRPFFLPAVQPLAEEPQRHAPGPAADTLPRSRCCCTHPVAPTDPPPGQRLGQALLQQASPSPSARSFRVSAGTAEAGESVSVRQLARSARAGQRAGSPGLLPPVSVPPPPQPSKASGVLGDYLVTVRPTTAAAVVGGGTSSGAGGAQGRPVSAPRRLGRASPQLPRFAKDGSVVRAAPSPPPVDAADSVPSPAHSEAAAGTAGTKADTVPASGDEVGTQAAAVTDNANGSVAEVAALDQASAIDSARLEDTMPPPVTAQDAVTPLLSPPPPPLPPRQESGARTTPPLRTTAAANLCSAAVATADDVADQDETELCLSGVRLGQTAASAAAATPRGLLELSQCSSLIKPEAPFVAPVFRPVPKHGHPAIIPLQLNPTLPGKRVARSQRGGGAPLPLAHSFPAGRTGRSNVLAPPVQRATTASAARPYAGTDDSLPRMLAYSSAAAGDVTLNLYARELQQRLRRLQRSPTTDLL